MSLSPTKTPTIHRRLENGSRSQSWELIGVHRLPPSPDGRWDSYYNGSYIGTAEVLAIASDAKSLRDAMIDQPHDWYAWWGDGFEEYRIIPPDSLRGLDAVITDRTVDLIFDDAWTTFRDHFVSQHDARTMPPALYRDTHGEDPPPIVGDVLSGITAFCQIAASTGDTLSERGADHAS